MPRQTAVDCSNKRSSARAGNPGKSRKTGVDTVSAICYNRHADTMSTCLRKQKNAMRAANANYRYQSIYEITYACLIGLLGE